MLSRVDPTVRRETGYIALCVLIGSLAMEAVYLLLGAWTLPVLLGNLLGATLAVGNFFLMGLTIQKALGKSEADAKVQMKLSQQLRLLMLALGCVLGGALSCFDLVATLVPLLFPRLAVTIRGLTGKDKA
ncbi:MAG: hypothetical protein ACI4MJ_06025 [Aristaeellaceae bacterium]